MLTCTHTLIRTSICRLLTASITAVPRYPHDHHGSNGVSFLAVSSVCLLQVNQALWATRPALKVALGRDYREKYPVASETDLFAAVLVRKLPCAGSLAQCGTVSATVMSCA